MSCSSYVIPFHFVIWSLVSDCSCMFASFYMRECQDATFATTIKSLQAVLGLFLLIVHLILCAWSTNGDSINCYVVCRLHQRREGDQLAWSLWGTLLAPMYLRPHVHPAQSSLLNWIWFHLGHRMVFSLWIRFQAHQALRICYQGPVPRAVYSCWVKIICA